MKKIILIILIVISLGLIGTGIYFSLSNNKSGSNNEGIVDVEELLNNEDVITENVHKYRTIDDAVEYLKGIYVTEDVEVSYNDGIKATIKVFPDTDEQIRYTYFVNGGDLIIE